MKKYIIVKHINGPMGWDLTPSDINRPLWRAYRAGILSRLGIFNNYNYVYGAMSLEGEQDCCLRLLKSVQPTVKIVKSEVVKEIEI